MGKSVIITEKPSVARDFAKVLRVSGNHDGYIENDKWIITWCVGHLVALLYPESYDPKYKVWKLEDLPFLPEKYKYGVISSVKTQYQVVHKILHRLDVDTVYWAGDAGKEGQVIEENIRRYGGVGKNIKELRVWIDSQTEEEIRRGIREAKPMQAYDNLANSGVMRAVEDYAMGINFSRTLTCLYGRLLNNAANLSKYTPISVGRVMTCVQGMVVNREREIRNFKEESFYKIAGSFGEQEISAEWKADEKSAYYNSPLLYNESGFKDKAQAELLIKKLNGKPGVVSRYEETQSKKKAPLLFNLAEIQSECSKKFKISPDETLQIIQKLYENKLVTYPRTDSRVLSSAVGKVIADNIQGLREGNYLTSFTDEILSKKLYLNINSTQYVNDKKVSDHYAIIPTGNMEKYSTLSELEIDIFDLIVRRFLSIFYPPAVYRNVKADIKVDNECFHASGKELISSGYLDVLSEEIKPGKTIPKLKEGVAIAVKGLNVKEGKTTPPKRYTSGSMILAMENAGQLIEDEQLREQIKSCGIGTSATRAEIIKKLTRIGYINLNKKTQILTPTSLGEMIYEVVSSTVPEMLNPKMTAQWDKDLEGIANGEISYSTYIHKMEVYIKTEVDKMRNQNKNTELIEKIKPYATGSLNTESNTCDEVEGVVCPECAGKIKRTPYGYACENYKKSGGCSFAISSKICGKNISDNMVKELIKNGKTKVLKGFKSKSGNSFDAMLVYTDKKITFAFPEPEQSHIVCPKCGKKLTKNRYTMDCECGYKIYYVIAGKELSDKDIRELITNKKTRLIRGFKSKSGKKFDAYLVLNDEGKIKFEFS